METDLTIATEFPGQGSQSHGMQAGLAAAYPVAQGCRPVPWVRAIEVMLAASATSVVECGPGKVLVGPVRRIAKGIAFTFIDNSDSLEKALQGWRYQLTGGSL